MEMGTNREVQGIRFSRKIATLDDHYTEFFLNFGDDDGEGLGTEDLWQLSLKTKISVVLIDWYTDFLNGEIRMPIILAWRAGGAVQLFKFENGVDASDLTVYKMQMYS